MREQRISLPRLQPQVNNMGQQTAQQVRVPNHTAQEEVRQVQVQISNSRGPRRTGRLNIRGG